MGKLLKDKFYSLIELSQLFKERKLKPSEVTDFYLSRITKVDKEIQAFEEVYRDSATLLAKKADLAFESGKSIGPFHGIPFVLKDIFDVQDKITTSGSKLFNKEVAKSTSSMAKHLLDAGGILLGKSKTVQFAFGGWGTNQEMGTPRNPWDNKNHRICGGSSSGSAAALASNLTVCATGTDTGGSVRLPASFCGLTGLKVTKGLLSTKGIAPLSHTLDTPGPMARSLLDLVIMFETMKGAQGTKLEENMLQERGLFKSIEEGVEGLHIGSIGIRDRSICSNNVLKRYDEVLQVLENQGAKITEFNPPFNYQDLAQRIGNIIAIEAYSYYGRFCEDRKCPMDEDVRKRILIAKNFSNEQYLKLLEQRKTDEKLFLDSMLGFDALVTPTTLDEAPLITDVDQEISPGHFTRPFNYITMCALSIPIGLNRNNLPVGLQIAARSNCEDMAIRIGGEVERHQSSIF